MKTSSLSLGADRSSAHLRWSKSADGWGGDEDVSLAQVDTIDLRLEEVESVGEANRWNLWVFKEDTDLQEEDIVIISDAGLALVVKKVAEYTKLRGAFHHYEVLTEEHEHSVGELLAALP